MKQLCAMLLAVGVVLAAGTTREIEGRVVDSQTGAPIARARVTVTFFSPGGEQSTALLLSDEGGAFDLKNAPQIPYQVTCQRSGYLQITQPDQAKGDSGKWLVKMMPQVVIEGVVVDEKGTPVPFATVQVYRQAVVEGRLQPELVSGNPADDAGNFRVFGLKADRFWVGVTIPPRPQLSKVTYRPVFYPDSPDIQGAELMDLYPGEQRHLRIRLTDSVPSREIRGTVPNATEGVNVSLRSADAALSAQPLNVNSRWDPKTREFRITGVAAGAYVLEVMTSMANQQLIDSRPLTVGEHDITGLRMEPHPPAPITGVVRLVGSDQPAGAVPPIELRSRRGRFGAPIDAGGSFAIIGAPPETYRLMLSSAGPVYLKSAWQGSRDVLEEGLAISPELPATPIEIEVTGPGATLEGSVPESAMGVVVALLRRAGNELVLAKEWRGSRRFTMQGVAPGDYLVYCWPLDRQVAYAEPGFLQQYGTMGKEVTVKVPEKIRVDLDRVVQ